MKKMLYAIMAVSLAAPSLSLAQGNSVGNRNDDDFPFMTRGECERAGQRIRSVERKQGNRNYEFQCTETETSDGTVFILTDNTTG